MLYKGSSLFKICFSRDEAVWLKKYFAKFKASLKANSSLFSMQ